MHNTVLSTTAPKNTAAIKGNQGISRVDLNGNAEVNPMDAAVASVMPAPEVPALVIIDRAAKTAVITESTVRPRQTKYPMSLISYSSWRKMIGQTL
jgi:hypothetical protein